MRCMHAVYRDDARQPPEGAEEEERGRMQNARVRAYLSSFETRFFALVAFFFTVSV